MKCDITDFINFIEFECGHRLLDWRKRILVEMLLQRLNGEPIYVNTPKGMGYEYALKLVDEYRAIWSEVG